MLRIHFTSTDLAHTYVAETPDPMWEIVLSLHMLRANYGRVAFADWRHRVRGKLHQHGLVDMVRKLAPIAPDSSYFPDFLTPPEGLLGIEAGIETVIATPRSRIRRELEILNERTGTPSWAWDLADGDRAARTELGSMLERYYRRAVAPYWPVIDDRAANDRAIRTRALRERGITGLLNSFRPAMHWRPPVLEVKLKAYERDWYLDGRGLVLIPSQFCWFRPVPIYDPELPPTLIYPLSHDPQWMDRTTAPLADSSLTKLIGATRAAILQAAVTGPNTTEIARRLGVSLATVSEHTTILREAGLITSRRHDNNMLHLITPLGAALLKRPHGLPQA